MFQCALAYVMAVKYNSRILVDKELFKLTEKKPGHTPRSYELGIFDHDLPSATRKDIDYFERLSLSYKIKRELGLNFPKMCYENHFSSDNIVDVIPPVYLRGFFQSYKYFCGHEELVRNFFRFPLSKLDPKNRKILGRIKKTHSVAVHIRRGDYVKDKITNDAHGVCSKEYYQRAMEKIGKMTNDVVFYFFSDDIAWVKSEFESFEGEKIFVDENKGAQSWKDMMLMSSCEHNIIANSSFSWWAAWLNSNKSKKVIAPRRWYKDIDKERKTLDLIPREWIRM